MVKKSKGRQKIEMVKMKNESNLQVTFSKRRFGLFKKACELCTLCAAEIAIIVFSPGRKVFSFFHPSFEYIIDRFLNNNPRQPSHQYNNNNNMQLVEVRRNSIQNLNADLTQISSHLESEKKKAEELKKMRKHTKALGHWMEEPVERLDLSRLSEFKGHLENLKNIVTHEASKLLRQTAAVPNFYVGSSSNAAFGTDHDHVTHLNPDFDLFGQGRMMDINALNFNQNPIHPNPPMPFGFNFHGNNINEGSVPQYRPDYYPLQIQNQNQNQSFKREDIFEYDHGHPPHSRSGY